MMARITSSATTAVLEPNESLAHFFIRLAEGSFDRDEFYFLGVIAIVVAKLRLEESEIFSETV